MKIRKYLSASSALVGIFFLWTLALIHSLFLDTQTEVTFFQQGWLFSSSVLYAFCFTLWALSASACFWLRSSGRMVYGTLFTILALFHIDAVLYANQKFHLKKLFSYALSGHLHETLVIIKFSGIPFIALLIACLFPIGFFFLGFKIGERRFLLSRRVLILLSIFSFPVLFLEQVVSSKALGSRILEMQQRSFLFYPVFIRPQSTLMQIPAVLKPYSFSTDLPSRLPSSGKNQSSAESRPTHIFLFVLESFRGSFVKPEITPNLARFGQEDAIQFTRTFSNGNATVHSWFSIFEGLYPFRRLDPKILVPIHGQGSKFLRALSKDGYAVHLLSASNLGWGEGLLKILGSNQGFASDSWIYPGDVAWQGDQLLVDKFAQELNPSGKHVYVIFFESTHSAYDFAPEFKVPFPDFSGKLRFEHFQPRPSKRAIERIRNRYWNSMAYVDQQWGKVEDEIRKKKLYDRSIIAVVGDHGEEFFEKGMYGHNYHLYDELIHVPIFIKIPGAPHQVQSIATQIDIFPTILGALGFSVSDQGVDGRNLLKDPRRTGISFCDIPMKVDSDFQVSIQNAKFKILADWVDTDRQGQLRIKEVLENEKEIPLTPQDSSRIFSILNRDFDLSEEEIRFLKINTSREAP